MYDWLGQVVGSLHTEVRVLYWILILPVVLLTIVFEYFKLPEKNPDVAHVIRRAIISMILLLSFDQVVDLIMWMGNGIAEHLGGMHGIKDTVNKMGETVSKIEASWTSIKGTLVFAIGMLSWVFAYIGAFVSDAAFQFCWSILIIMAPLMILAYVCPSSANMTSSLYRSLCAVMSWKVLWAVLGVFLTELTMVLPFQSGTEYNAIMLVGINLFIGFAMLSVPVAAKSFLSDGLASYATGLSAAASIMVSRWAGHKIKGGFNSGAGTMLGAGALGAGALKAGSSGVGMSKGDSFRRSPESWKTSKRSIPLQGTPSKPNVSAKTESSEVSPNRNMTGKPGSQVQFHRQGSASDKSLARPTSKPVNKLEATQRNELNRTQSSRKKTMKPDGKGQSVGKRDKQNDFKPNKPLDKNK